jgi:hypothetical protein
MRAQTQRRGGSAARPSRTRGCVVRQLALLGEGLFTRGLRCMPRRLVQPTLLKEFICLLGLTGLGWLAIQGAGRDGRGLCGDSRSPPSTNAYERALTGVWHSSDTAEGAAAGMLILGRDRQAKLEPAKQGVVIEPIKGTWSATAQTLHIEIPNRGGANLLYKLTAHGRVLSVTYVNGIRQRFTRQSNHAVRRQRT